MTTTQPSTPTKHRTAIGVPPLAMRTMQAAFAGLGSVAPSTTAKMAHKVYFSPRRFPWPAREQAYLREAHRFHVTTPHMDVAAYAWGPELLPWEARAAHNTVLLVHGWEGRGTQLGAFIEPLVASGYRVVALDGPAHGHSPGEQADLLQFKDAIKAVARHVGGVNALIAHSMGGASSVIAMADGLDVERAVLIGAPSRLDDVMTRFARFMHLTPSTERELRRMIESDFGDDVWQRLSCESMARGLHTRALIIHDADDEEVPFSDALLNANAWPGATLHRTHGLGHRRVLKDPDVIREVTSFITRGANQNAG